MHGIIMVKPLWTIRYVEIRDVEVLGEKRVGALGHRRKMPEWMIVMSRPEVGARETQSPETTIIDVETIYRKGRV